MKNYSPEMKRLQRKLIPVNLLVCILCLVSAFTLVFSPILKIDLGKIIGNQQVQTFIMDKVSEMVDKETESAANSGESGGTGDILASLDLTTLVSPVLTPVFNAVEGDIEVSAYFLMEVGTADDPAEKLLGDKLYGDSGLIKKLTNSITKGVEEALKPETMGPVLTSVVKDVVSTAVVSYMPDEYKDVVDPEELSKTIDKLDEVTSEEEAIAVVDEYIDTLVSDHTLEEMDEETREELRSQISDMYQKTVEHTRDEDGNDNFTMEAFICVMASEQLSDAGMDGGMDLGELLDSLTNSGDNGNGEDGGSGSGSGEESGDEDKSGGGNEDSGSLKKDAKYLTVRFILADGEIKEPDAGTDKEPDVRPDDGETGEGETGSGESGEDEKQTTIYTNFGDLLGNMVTVPDDFGDQVSEKVVSMMTGEMDDVNKAINDNSMYFMIAFGVFAFFAGLWLILFIFAFFHMFAKNKRFTMWYVKLLAIYPCIIFWLVPALIPMVLPTMIEVLSIQLEAEIVAVIPAALTGYSSMTWISGLCYLILWAVSIFWAFPIKRKIRKLKKSY